MIKEDEKNVRFLLFQAEIWRFYVVVEQLSLRSDPQQRHGDDDEKKIDGFGLDVLFFEQNPATQEAHEDAGAANERGD